MKKTLFATCVLMASMTASAQFINQSIIDQAAEMAATGNIVLGNQMLGVQEVESPGSIQFEQKRGSASFNMSYEDFNPSDLSIENRKIVNMFRQIFKDKPAYEQRCDGQSYADTRQNGNMKGIKKLADMFEQCEKEFPLRKKQKR